MFRWIFALPENVRDYLEGRRAYQTGDPLPPRRKWWNVWFVRIFNAPMRLKLFLEGKPNPRMACGCHKY
jgi:hypothetical protein